MENQSVDAVAVDDFKQVHNFEVKGGEVVGPKIKFPKAVYDRIQAFGTRESFYNSWTYYGIMQLILGRLKSEEFKQWFDEHHTLGPVLIMLALVYGNYELGYTE